MYLKPFFAHQFSLVFVYVMCGPRLFVFFQCGPETPKVWIPLWLGMVRNQSTCGAQWLRVLEWAYNNRESWPKMISVLVFPSLALTLILSDENTWLFPDPIRIFLEL